MYLAKNQVSPTPVAYYFARDQSKMYGTGARARANVTGASFTVEGVQANEMVESSNVEIGSVNEQRARSNKTVASLTIERAQTDETGVRSTV